MSTNINPLDLSSGFDAGNYANAYESEDLFRAMAKDSKRFENKAYTAAFILGFFSSYESAEIPMDVQAEHASALASDQGQAVIAAGYIDNPEGLSS